MSPDLNIQLHASFPQDPMLLLLPPPKLPPQQKTVLPQRAIKQVCRSSDNFLPERITSSFWERYQWGDLYSGPLISFCSRQKLERLFARVLHCVSPFVNAMNSSKSCCLFAPRDIVIESCKNSACTLTGCFSHPCLCVLWGSARWVVLSLRGL